MNGTLRQAGLTLIELTVITSIAAILLTLSIPGFQSVSAKVPRSAAVTGMAGGMFHARSGAKKRGVGLTPCPGKDSSTCLEGPDPDWSRGWVVFAGGDNKLRLEIHHKLLRVSGFDTPRYGLMGADALQPGTTFRPTGLAAETGLLNYCEADGQYGTQLRMPFSGYGRIETLENCEPI
jgi:Tfp pilus assembly protein FimT